MISNTGIYKRVKVAGALGARRQILVVQKRAWKRAWLGKSHVTAIPSALSCLLQDSLCFSMLVLRRKGSHKLSPNIKEQLTKKNKYCKVIIYKLMEVYFHKHPAMDLAN